jgi:hypothetical protein
MGEYGSRYASRYSFVNIPSSQIAERLFARQAYQQRQVEFPELVQSGEYVQIVIIVLAEAEAWVNDEPIVVDTGISTSLHPISKESDHFARQIIVMRLQLHVGWGALHMHQANRAVQRRSRTEGPFPA